MAAKEPKAEIHRVGTINGLSIYDVFYRFQTEGNPDWKSILVKTGANSYREIYHCEPTQIDASALPSTIVRLGKDALLNSRYLAGGNKGMYGDDYYWFGPEGPTLVDFSPIAAAGQAALPKGLHIWGGGDANSFETLASMKFELNVLSEKSSLCCDEGIVEVTFRFDHGHVIVTEARFNPNGQD
jgi:hypothetical protein